MELWFKNAIVYTIDVGSVRGWERRRHRRFPGLTGKLDYLAGLNVNCIWLQPFFPPPDGTTDTMSPIIMRRSAIRHARRLCRVLAAARDRGIRILSDLVVNHASIDHPWYQEARRDPKSRYRDYFVWSKDKPPHADEGMVFPGQGEDHVDMG